MTDTCEKCGLPLTDAGFCNDQSCEAFEGAMRPASSPSAAGMASNAAQPGSAAPSSADAYSDAQLARLRDLHQRRARGELACEFITICGFPTAGKTWLTPRLKSDLIARRGWSYEADEREHAQTEREILAGIKSMGQTEDLLIHSLTPGRGLAGTSIKLIDIPGEYLRRLAEPGEDADLPLALLVALAISDRIILTLPSDVCVIGSLIHRAIAAETDPRRKKARSAEVLDRDTNRLAVDRQELAERLRDMRDAEQEQSTDYATAFATFKDVSIQLSQTLLAEQWTKLSRFATRIRRVIGRAAYLGHTVGRDKIFDLPPESWISATANLEDRDTIALTQGSYAVLTKADRVLPLLTERDYGLNPCAEWDYLPERTENAAALADSGWRDQLAPHVGDPRLLLATIMPELVAQFDTWLPNMRYEWASADWQAGDWSIELDMDNQCVGITQLSDWLCDGAPAITASQRAVASVARLRTMIEGRQTPVGNTL